MENLKNNLIRKGFEPIQVHYREHRNIFRNLTALHHALPRRSLILDSYGFSIEYPSWRTAIPWIVLKRLKRFQWIKIVHDSTLPARFGHFRLQWRILFQVANRLVDKWIAVNREILETVSRFNASGKSVSLIGSLLPYEIDFESIEESNVVDPLKTRYQGLVCSVGTLAPYYGFQHVVEAVENIRGKTGENIGLLLIDGGTIMEATDEHSILKNRPWIEILRKVPHRETLSIIKSCDVFVRSTERESYGLSKIEAIMVGTPVISTKAGATRGMHLYDFGDVGALERCLEAVLHHSGVPDAAEAKKMYLQIGDRNLEEVIAIIKDGS